MAKVLLTQEVDLAGLAPALASTEAEYDELIQFVVDLDLEIADVSFTEDLIDALQKSLNDEVHPHPGQFEA